MGIVKYKVYLLLKIYKKAAKPLIPFMVFLRLSQGNRKNTYTLSYLFPALSNEKSIRSYRPVIIKPAAVLRVELNVSNFRSLADPFLDELTVFIPRRHIGQLLVIVL